MSIPDPATTLSPSLPVDRTPDQQPARVQFHEPWGLAARIVVMTLATVVGLWLVVTLRAILLQVVIAIILATGFGPLVDHLQRARLPRGVSVLLIYLALILAVIALGVAVIPPVLRETDRVIAEAPHYGEVATEMLRNLRLQFPFLPPLDEHLLQWVRGLGSQIGTLMSQALVVARFALGFFSGVLSSILVLLITLYLIVDGMRIREYFLGFLDPSRRHRVRLVTDRMGRRMGGWLLGQITLSTVVGLVSWIGLTILGIHGAVLLAVIAAVGEAIPLVGPIAAAVPAVLVAATQSPLLALLTLGLYILIQQLENNLLVPKIMERAVNLHPLAVVLSLLAGSELLGVTGAVIAVPVAAAISVVLDEVRRERLRNSSVVNDKIDAPALEPRPGDSSRTSTATDVRSGPTVS
jgi:predicted PurR-regulated permease PerM